MTKDNSNFAALVSVIIPFYNRIPLVVESIKSVLAQTYQNFEIILVDDGSTEDISAVVSLTQIDKRIHLFKGEHKGVSEARNLALTHVKGAFIAFLDSDDLFMPEKLAIQTDYMIKNQLSFSHTSYNKIDMEGRPCGIAHSGRFDGKVYPSIIGGCSLATPTIMVRSEVFLQSDAKFKSDFHIGEDVCLWIDLAQKYEFGGLDIPLSTVRIGATSAAYDPNKLLIGLNNIYQYCKAHPIHGEFDEQFYRLEVQMNDCRKVKKAHEEFEKKYKEVCNKREKLKKKFEQKAFMPLVSIIIPVYNGSNYLHEAIESALLQTYPNIEVLVINDGSKDGGTTESVAMRYGDRIRYITKENGGVASALNRGIEEMQGEYVSWLSHDDLYTNEKVESQVRMLMSESDKKRIICGGYSLFRASDGIDFGTMDPFPMHEKKLSIPLYPVFRGLLNGCTMLIHKSHFERVGGFDESLPTTQDYDLWFRMLRGQSVLFQRGFYMRSRCHEEQGSRTMAHKSEAAQLWRNMMDSVTDAECIQMEGDVYSFYKNLYIFLKTNLPANIHAWGHAKRKAIDCVIAECKIGNGSKTKFEELLGKAYKNEISIILHHMITCQRETKRIALIRFGSVQEGYQRLIHLMKQSHPEYEFYYIDVVPDDTAYLLGDADALNGLVLTLSMLDTDTLSSLLAFMQVDCAFVFTAADGVFQPYYNVSICDTRFVAVHNLNKDAVVNLPSLCLEEAWAVVGMDSSTHFLDGSLLPNHFTYNYSFMCALAKVMRDATTEDCPVVEMDWYHKLMQKEEAEQQKDLSTCTELLFGADLLRNMANEYRSERMALEQARLEGSYTVGATIIECERCRAMEKTLSWRITKPLRRVRQVQMSLRSDGVIATIKKVFCHLRGKKDK